MPVYGTEIVGKAYLIKGKDELESGKYENAIVSLSTAGTELPLLGDYALLWLSDAYHAIGKHEESLKTVQTLLNKYPVSPLIKKARMREIMESEETQRENIQQMYESYLKDFPDDNEMKYFYALWLKKMDNKDIAKSVFKDIYISTGLFSEISIGELDPSEISVADLIKRASNLMEKRDFKGAESAFRAAMEKDDGNSRAEILKGLGLSLFRQKKYLEAAKLFEEAKEIYWQARSLYRAGEKKGLNSTLENLLKSGDERGGRILVSVASDLRREGNIEEAIKTYKNVIEQYPSYSEDALWGIGWAYFLTGEYKKASEIFTKLYDAYNDNKYLYWNARCLEAGGENALKIYHIILEKDNDFYSIMAYIKAMASSEELAASGAIKFSVFTTPVKNLAINPDPIDRVEALIELGLSKEAVSELIYISKYTSSIEEILYICSKFQELGEYKYLVRLAAKLPSAEDIYRFRYPPAYLDIVNGLSMKYEIDPSLVLSVMREESRFDPDARSIAGALGLMQIMPQTAYRIDNDLKIGINDPYNILDIETNLHIGTYLLSNLINEFGSYSYALAAYNAGREKVRMWLQNGKYKSVEEFIEDIPYPETREYVKRVITTYFEYKRFSSFKEGLIEIPIEKL